jgi:hypothetical protein
MKLTDFGGKAEKSKMGEWAEGQIDQLKRLRQEHGIVVMKT